MTQFDKVNAPLNTEQQSITGSVFISGSIGQSATVLNNVNYTASYSDSIIIYRQLSAGRTILLPSGTQPQLITIVDGSGVANYNSIFRVNVAVRGSDSCNNVTVASQNTQTNMVLNTPYQVTRVFTAGDGKWYTDGLNPANAVIWVGQFSANNASLGVQSNESIVLGVNSTVNTLVQSSLLISSSATISSTGSNAVPLTILAPFNNNANLSNWFTGPTNAVPSASISGSGDIVINGSGSGVVFTDVAGNSIKAFTSNSVFQITSSVAVTAITASFALTNAGNVQSATSATYAATSSITLGSISTASLALNSLNSVTASVAKAALGIIRLGDGQWQPWIADGVTDCTNTLRNAVASASLPQWSNKILVGSEPINNASGYGILISASFGNPIVVPTNIALEGDGGQATLLTIATGSYINSPNNKSLSMFTVIGNNVKFSNIAIDGRCNDVAGIAAITQSLSTIGIFVTSSNCLIEDVQLTNGYSTVGNEGFGIYFANSSASTALNCVVSNWSGSGFHDAGAASFNNRFIGCVGFGNIFNGVTIFFTAQSQVIGGFFYNNRENGINVECSAEVQLSANNIRNCGESGISVLGFTPYLSIVGNTLKANNNRFSTFGNGEINIFMADAQGFAPGIQVIGNVINPISGGLHIAIQNGSPIGPITTGSSVPDIAIEAADIAEYAIGVKPGFTAFNSALAPANTKLHSLRNAGKQLTTGTFPILPQWTGNAVISSSIPINLGTSGSFPIKLTATTSSANWATSYQFQPGRRYLLSVRANCFDTASGWQLSIQDTNATYRTVQFPSQSQDLGLWTVSDLIATVTASAGLCRLNITPFNFATTSSVIIDYLDVRTLPYIGSQLNNDNTFLLGVSSSYSLTSSFALNAGSGGGGNNSGSFTGSFTGSLLGTASFAQTAISASQYASGTILFASLTASAVTGSVPAVVVYGSSSQAADLIDFYPTGSNALPSSSVSASGAFVLNWTGSYLVINGVDGLRYKMQVGSGTSSFTHF